VPIYIDNLIMSYIYIYIYDDNDLFQLYQPTIRPYYVIVNAFLGCFLSLSARKQEHIWVFVNVFLTCCFLTSLKSFLRSTAFYNEECSSTRRILHDRTCSAKVAE
jgi:hypothetical protein